MINKLHKFVANLKTFENINTRLMMIDYYRRFKNYSFIDCKCKTDIQLEASITRLYHTIEKGLAYSDFRPGFGKDNVDKLILSLEQYQNKGYNINKFSYTTALSCLYEYIRKNKEYNFVDHDLEERVNNLPGKPNNLGGVITVEKPTDTKRINYEALVKSRHSIRHFDTTPVDIDVLKDAIQLAQFTPSACNRQGWKTRIIADKEKIKKILENQNGNRGFGQEFDKLLIVTADLRSQQKSRELFQAYIDGGMYAESVLNSLFYYGIGAVPLSASLTPLQEKEVRKTVSIHDAEVLILIIGVGNYPNNSFLTTRSERKPIEIEVL